MVCTNYSTWDENDRFFFFSSFFYSRALWKNAFVYIKWFIYGYAIDYYTSNSLFTRKNEQKKNCVSFFIHSFNIMLAFAYNIKVIVLSIFFSVALKKKKIVLKTPRWDWRKWSKKKISDTTWIYDSIEWLAGPNPMNVDLIMVVNCRFAPFWLFKCSCK